MRQLNGLAINTFNALQITADPNDRESAADRCGFESRWGHGCVHLVMFVFIRVRVFLRRADHPSRGVQPTVVSQCV
jgi:hypothetical protein